MQESKGLQSLARGVLGGILLTLGACSDIVNPPVPAPDAARVGANSASSRPPVADPGGPYAGTVGTAVVFDGGGSSDPDGPSRKLTYDWDFGDGSQGSGATPSHGYAGAGTYTVTLVVTDHKGTVSNPATTEVTVAVAGGGENENPIADAGGPYAGTAGTSVSFDGTSSSDPDDDEPLTYEWDFGDGSTGDGATPTHTYVASGSYTVTLVVTDDRGARSAPDETVAEIAGTGSAVVLVGAGDIADCSSSGDEATAALLDGIAGTVFTTGDNAYPDGTRADFDNCYDPSWGRHKSRTRPSPGNHDYNTTGASGYFDYFGASAGDPDEGYYSYDLGAWHIVVLNSNISLGAGSAQEQWLRADLAANPTLCTLAYWHHPLFSSSDNHGNQDFVQPLWDALYEFGADVVLGGHDHVYERFAPQTPDGIADPANGIREFVIGLGGRSLYSFAEPEPNSEVRYSGSFAVLKLTLDANGYSWDLVPTSGSFTDTGRGTCH